MTNTLELPVFSSIYHTSTQTGCEDILETKKVIIEFFEEMKYEISDFVSGSFEVLFNHELATERKIQEFLFFYKSGQNCNATIRRNIEYILDCFEENELDNWSDLIEAIKNLKTYREKFNQGLEFIAGSKEYCIREINAICGGNVLDGDYLEKIKSRGNEIVGCISSISHSIEKYKNDLEQIIGEEDEEMAYNDYLDKVDDWQRAVLKVC